MGALLCQVWRNDIRKKIRPCYYKLIAIKKWILDLSQGPSLKMLEQPTSRAPAMPGVCAPPWTSSLPPSMPFFFHLCPSYLRPRRLLRACGATGSAGRRMLLPFYLSRPPAWSVCWLAWFD